MAEKGVEEQVLAMERLRSVEDSGVFKKEREIEQMLDFSFFYLKLDYSFILLRHLRHRSRS